MYCVTIVFADGTGCAKLIIWNKKARVIVVKTANELKVESVTSTGLSDGLGGMIGFGAIQENDSEVNCGSVVSLSNSNSKPSQQTPIKLEVLERTQQVAMLESLSTDVQGSSNNTFKRVGGKRKLE
ncbi:hypothetical protein PIB30_061635 [Stylosanthes scabra]|uniref:Uncharacterized protein n=1 Tax=Stylosanthes scabra TaxID=79078 RepID=A0ABU6ULS7_9FABA|nr:hypothetical protein [Stylosanthes scabra]